MKKLLKQVDRVICENKPGTMDEIISLVHSIPGLGLNTVLALKLLNIKGYTQGVRVYITGRKISQPITI